MKVEIISIGTRLLMSDILDTGTAYLSRSMREVNLELTCKVTVGDEPDMVADAIRVALRRADFVLTTGGLGKTEGDLTRRALEQVLGREVLSSRDKVGLLGKSGTRGHALLIEHERGTLICLPGDRREMAYLVETGVLPYIRRRLASEPGVGWALLRTVGVMESSLKRQLEDIVSGANHRITFDSFAGQTNIQIWVKSKTTQQAEQDLDEIRQAITARLGDHVYGEGEDRLEDVVLDFLSRSGKKLSLAECYTGQSLAKTLAASEHAGDHISPLPANSWIDVAQLLELNELSPHDDLTGWCRTVAEQTRARQKADIGLVIYKNVTPGGVQVLVTLASPLGVSVTQRTFGGHPENINPWACTLGLAHLRRWLLAHR
ncbi:MAG: molybdopterin-binding protein [Anaerolineae bacterium]